jgi:hypothetical protein
LYTRQAIINRLNDRLAQVDVASKRAKDAFDALSATIDSFGIIPTQSLKIVLYFDEAHTLMTKVPPQTGRDPILPRQKMSLRRIMLCIKLLLV